MKFLIPGIVLSIALSACSTSNAVVPPTATSASERDGLHLRNLVRRAAAHPIASLPSSGSRMPRDWGGVRIDEEALASMRNLGRVAKSSRTSVPLFFATASPHGASAPHIEAARRTRILGYTCLITIYGWDYGTSWVYDYSTEDCWTYDLGSDPSVDSPQGGAVAAATSSPSPSIPLNPGCANADGSAAKELKPVMAASNAQNQEYAGFVLQNNADGSLWTTPARALPFNSDGGGTTVTLGVPPTVDGYRVLGFYHTHPALGAYSGDDLDVNTNTHFSQEDNAYAQRYNVLSWVAVDRYIADNFRQTHLYRLDPTNVSSDTDLGILGNVGC